MSNNNSNKDSYTITSLFLTSHSIVIIRAKENNNNTNNNNDNSHNKSKNNKNLLPLTLSSSSGAKVLIFTLFIILTFSNCSFVLSNLAESLLVVVIRNISSAKFQRSDGIMTSVLNWMTSSERSFCSFCTSITWPSACNLENDLRERCDGWNAAECSMQ